MNMDDAAMVNCRRFEIESDRLKRTVFIDVYQPENLSNADRLEILLINDGQDLQHMKFSEILKKTIQGKILPPIVCIGIHAGKERLMEYGIIGEPDYKGRGGDAHLYRDFILGELIPSIPLWLATSGDAINFSMAGFSLGGLSALDLAWKHPDIFRKVGVFSGALWWREKDQTETDFDESKHLIMHRQVRETQSQPGLRFFFQAGTKDETADRNNNGIIDSIDDTLSLIKILKEKEVQAQDISYLQMEDGRHDIATWASAFPAFLEWGWGAQVTK